MFSHNYIALAFLIVLTMGSLASVSLADESKSLQLNKEAYENLKAGNYERMHTLSKRALALAISENNPTEHARALSNLASGLSYLGQKEKALELYSQSLAISKLNNNIAGIDRAFNNIAGIYTDLLNFHETLRYRKLQLANALSSEDPGYLLTAYLGLINVYTNLGRTEKSQLYITQSERILAETPDSFLAVYLLFEKAGLFNKLKEHAASISSLQKALHIAKQNNYKGLAVSLRSNLAEYYFLAEDYSEALQQAKLSLVEARGLRLKGKQAEMHALLSSVYAQKKKFEKALEHNKREQELSVSITGERIRVLAEITRIDRQIAETEQMLQESQQNQKILLLRMEQQNQTQIIWLITLSGLGILALFILYRRSANKELERQRRLNIQLKELDVVKDRVLTNTSHELRTPLNGIIGLSDIIIQDEEEKLSSSTLSSLKLIKKSGEQLALVINDILEFSRLKSKKLTVINSDFNLTRLINDVIKVCQPSIVNKDIAIKFASDDESLDIHQDRGRLQQILFNVIGNAIKFTRQGGIVVNACCENNELLISVQDSGIGIPEDKAERIFEGFEQVDASDSREYAGSGLGLAISRGLAEALGGSIELCSTLGEGTLVEIRLPC